MLFSHDNPANAFSTENVKNKPVWNIYLDVPYRLFSCNLLFDVGHDGFDCLLQQNDIQPVTDFYPPARCGLDFGFQRVCEVLHLGFHQLLDVIQVDGLDGRFGFAPSPITLPR